MTGELKWWQSGVIYQIYPRSFQDSGGDGVGDLPGITAKLPYLRDLGVDALWISPFYTSPMADAGYDVADYRDIDPLFGTLDDAKTLVSQAHSLGIRVIVDLVPNHSSDEHEWFQQAKTSRDNKYRDYYIWKDPKGFDEDGNEVFAPGFSMWTIIEECLNPPVVWEKDRGWFTTPPFSEPEVFDFPEGIGPVECVQVEHEEVLLMPRWVDAQRVTFKYGLGEQMISMLKTLHELGLDSTEKVSVKGVEVSPRDVVAACLPDPATIGPRMEGKTCAGLFVTGTGKNGAPRATYLYHVVDNADTMRDYDAQCVVWQTAINPVVALELLATGMWSGSGVLGPEAFDAVPFLDLLKDYGSPWGMQEKPVG